MKIVGARRPGSKNISRVREISRLAKQRLKWMDHYAGHGNAALTCRYFGISRQTFYRWKGRYNSGDLRSLEERSHRSRRLRKPTWSWELALAVLHLREQYPCWGKDKLVVMIRDRGWQVSTSMVGRILSSLKARGVLREPLRSTISTRKRLWRRPYAVRKPKGYGVKEPGDLVQVDTLDVRPLPGMVLKHFTARDVGRRHHSSPYPVRAGPVLVRRNIGMPPSDLLTAGPAPTYLHPVPRHLGSGNRRNAGCVDNPHSLMLESASTSGAGVLSHRHLYKRLGDFIGRRRLSIAERPHTRLAAGTLGSAASPTLGERSRLALSCSLELGD